MLDRQKYSKVSTLHCVEGWSATILWEGVLVKGLGYKWIKWITEIELSNDPTYKGYWESGGYSQSGDLKGAKFE